MGDDATAAREIQLVEAESLEAIYGDDYEPIGDWRDNGATQVAFAVKLGDSLVVRLRMPANYPEGARPLVELSWAGSGSVPRPLGGIADHLETLPLGEEMAYAVVSWCQERLDEGCSEDVPAALASDAADAQVASSPKVVASKEVPASGGLPLASYFRAEALGEGACGAVMTVYDDDGQVWAAKQFEVAEDGGVDTTTLREIGLLRAFRGAGASHPNLIEIADMASINGELCMIMPNYTCSLRDALSGGALAATKGSQVRVAHGLLSAVAFMHACKSMHRDIKPGNVMLTDSMEPILIDFSLAKIEIPQAEEREPRTAKEKRRKARGKSLVKQNQAGEDVRHSQGVGTPMYMAPEVVESDEYGASADIWSLGVVLLEVFDPVFCSSLDALDKVKEGQALIASTKDKLGAKPIPSLLKATLELDPALRISAQDGVSRLRDAVPQGTLGVVKDLPAIELCKHAGSTTSGVSADVAAELRSWSAFLRCSGRVRTYSESYAARSALACATPLYATVLAARLHETDPEAAPLYDLSELEDWLYDEDDDEMLAKMQALDDYFEIEPLILRELDYVLY